MGIVWPFTFFIDLLPSLMAIVASLELLPVVGGASEVVVLPFRAFFHGLEDDGGVVKSCFPTPIVVVANWFPLGC